MIYGSQLMMFVPNIQFPAHILHTVCTLHGTEQRLYWEGLPAPLKAGPVRSLASHRALLPLGFEDLEEKDELLN